MLDSVRLWHFRVSYKVPPSTGCSRWFVRSEFLPDKSVIVIVDGVSRSDFLPDKYVKVTVDNICAGLNSYLTNL